MESDKVIELYLKEREYQKRVFGDYKNISVLNLASFLLLHREYVQKAENMYAQQWDNDLPPWLGNCREHEIQGTAPVKTYEAIIKNFALHGAAIETFTSINPSMWRFGEDIKPKWKI